MISFKAMELFVLKDEVYLSALLTQKLSRALSSSVVEVQLWAGSLEGVYYAFLLLPPKA